MSGPLLHVHRGTAPGVFGPDTTFSAGLSTQTIVAADFNRDGHLALPDFNGAQIVVLINQSK